jgi:hypothetical protein
MQGEAPSKTHLSMCFQRIQAPKITSVLNRRTSAIAKDTIVIILIPGFGYHIVLHICPIGAWGIQHKLTFIHSPYPS